MIGNAFSGWFHTATRAWLELLAPALGPVWLPVLQHALFAVTAWAVLLWLYRSRVFFQVRPERPRRTVEPAGGGVS